MDNLKRYLFKGEIIFFVLFFLFNVLNYFYHFFMGRLIGPSNFGILEVLFSILYIMVVPLTALQISITKFTSDFKDKRVNYLFYKGVREFLKYGLIIFLLFNIFSYFFFSDFLKIKFIYLFLISLNVIFMFLLPVPRGILQGLQRFKRLGISYISEGVIKLFGSLLLVWIGWKLFGALIAVVLSLFVSFILAIYFLRKKYHKGEEFKFSRIYGYSIYVLIALLSLTGYYTLDMILVKHFFNELDAGQYAALTLLGKIIYFGVMPVSMIMFPKIVENKARRGILWFSFALTALMSLFVVSFYYLFGEFLFRIIFGVQYLGISNLLWIYGLYIALFSLVYLLSFYYLALRKRRILIFLFLFNIIQVVLIYMFHNTLKQVIYVLLISIVPLFLLFLLGTWLWKFNVSEYRR